MSVDQIEEQIRQLTSSDLSRLTKWFESFLADRASSPDSDWQESADQIAELDRRLAEYKADAELAAPFASDYFERLKRQLADDRAKKASAG
jgi:hypothetical protein